MLFSCTKFVIARFQFIGKKLLVYIKRRWVLNESYVLQRAKAVLKFRYLVRT